MNIWDVIAAMLIVIGIIGSYQGYAQGVSSPFNMLLLDMYRWIGLAGFIGIITNLLWRKSERFG